MRKNRSKQKSFSQICPLCRLLHTSCSKDTAGCKKLFRGTNYKSVLDVIYEKYPLVKSPFLNDRNREIEELFQKVQGCEKRIKDKLKAVLKEELQMFAVTDIANPQYLSEQQQPQDQADTTTSDPDSTSLSPEDIQTKELETKVNNFYDRVMNRMNPIVEEAVRNLPATNTTISSVNTNNTTTSSNGSSNSVSELHSDTGLTVSASSLSLTSDTTIPTLGLAPPPLFTTVSSASAGNLILPQETLNEYESPTKKRVDNSSNSGESSSTKKKRKTKVKKEKAGNNVANSSLVDTAAKGLTLMCQQQPLEVSPQPLLVPTTASTSFTSNNNNFQTQEELSFLIQKGTRKRIIRVPKCDNVEELKELIMQEYQITAVPNLFILDKGFNEYVEISENVFKYNVSKGTLIYILLDE
ncbi:hypothetical protein ABK040_001761 [Willaertia magna]